VRGAGAVAVPVRHDPHLGPGVHLPAAPAHRCALTHTHTGFASRCCRSGSDPSDRLKFLPLSNFSPLSRLSAFSSGPGLPLKTGVITVIAGCGSTFQGFYSVHVLLDP